MLRARRISSCLTPSGGWSIADSWIARVRGTTCPWRAPSCARRSTRGWGGSGWTRSGGRAWDPKSSGSRRRRGANIRQETSMLEGASGRGGDPANLGTPRSAVGGGGPHYSTVTTESPARPLAFFARSASPPSRAANSSCPSLRFLGHLNFGGRSGEERQERLPRHGADGTLDPAGRQRTVRRRQLGQGLLFGRWQRPSVRASR